MYSFTKTDRNLITKTDSRQVKIKAFRVWFNTVYRILISKSEKFPHPVILMLKTIAFIITKKNISRSESFEITILISFVLCKEAMQMKGRHNQNGFHQVFILTGFMLFALSGACSI